MQEVETKSLRSLKIFDVLGEKFSSVQAFREAHLLSRRERGNIFVVHTMHGDESAMREHAHIMVIENLRGII